MKTKTEYNYSFGVEVALDEVLFINGIRKVFVFMVYRWCIFKVATPNG